MELSFPKIPISGEKMGLTMYPNFACMSQLISATIPETEVILIHT